MDNSGAGARQCCKRFRSTFTSTDEILTYALCVLLGGLGTEAPVQDLRWSAMAAMVRRTQQHGCITSPYPAA